MLIQQEISSIQITSLTKFRACLAGIYAGLSPDLHTWEKLTTSISAPMTWMPSTIAAIDMGGFEIHYLLNNCLLGTAIPYNCLWN